jgi:hypothetical protein
LRSWDPSFPHWKRCVFTEQRQSGRASRSNLRCRQSPDALQLRTSRCRYHEAWHGARCHSMICATLIVPVYRDRGANEVRIFLFSAFLGSSQTLHLSRDMRVYTRISTVDTEVPGQDKYASSCGYSYKPFQLFPPVHRFFAITYKGFRATPATALYICLSLSA